MTTDPLSVETEIFNRRKFEFEAEHNREWVVIHGDDYVEFFDDFQVAAHTAVSRFGRGPYLIKQIGEGVIPLPASVLYRPLP